MQVLVVDDSELARLAIRAALERGGYIVREAVSGEEALASIEERRPDLITLDLTLPDIDGYEVCRQLRSQETRPRLREIPVVFVTANDTIMGRVKGFEVGGTDFVTKEEDTTPILNAVHRILRPNQNLRETLALIAEDSEISLAMLRQHLNGSGVQVIEAVDGQQAIELATERRDDIDIVITDMRMPKKGGAAVCEHVRRNLGLVTVPIIVVSVVEELDSVLDVFKLGATDYILKPYVREELIARLNTHLEVRLLTRRLSWQIDELRQLNNLKDRFMEVASSNLQMPMRNVITSLEEITKEATTNKVDVAKLHRTTAAARQMLSMIGEMLTEG